jgi:hypothetical protein
MFQLVSLWLLPLLVINGFVASPCTLRFSIGVPGPADFNGEESSGIIRLQRNKVHYLDRNVCYLHHALDCAFYRSYDCAEV